jgi:diguanylate cyclase (GGDEF)-like protein
MFVNIAKDTEGAIAYYFRLKPELSNNTAGIFYSQTDKSEEYVRLEPTDLSLYDKNDTEHVGWYWQPYEAGTPIWMVPYHNQNTNLLIISYVVPLYYQNSFIGIVGMDFDYTVLTEIIHEIKIYENGFAHLELNDVIIHDGTKITDDIISHDYSEEYLRVSEVLTNGMTLVLSADYDDIRQIRYEIAYKILFIGLVFVLLFSFLVLFMVRKIVKPLRKLTDAPIKLSKGDYDVEIVHNNTLEINLLSTAFENMIMNLREHKKLQHLLAYRDALTGLRNAASYKEWSADFNKKIEDEKDNLYFGVAVLDINDLKKTNDSYGHNVGDKLIKASAHLIADTFKRSPVFRIGGDEFVVILQGRDLEDYDSLVAAFEEECENTYVEAEEENIKFNVSIAKGFSEFNVAVDHQISDVFKRADTAMYIDKKNTKLSLV